MTYRVYGQNFQKDCMLDVFGNAGDYVIASWYYSFQAQRLAKCETTIKLYDNIDDPIMGYLAPIYTTETHQCDNSTIWLYKFIDLVTPL